MDSKVNRVNSSEIKPAGEAPAPRKTFVIECADFMDHEDAGPWRSYDLYAEGATLEELLDSAVYSMTDQDGGDLGFRAADDEYAQTYIAERFKQILAKESA